MTTNRLLVIDDTPGNSAAIGRVARASGYDTIITTDVDDFRSRVRSWDPAVIVLDLNMPEMNGVEVMAWLAGQGISAQILIVSGKDITALNEARTLGQQFGLDIAGVLQKPLRVAALRAAFRSIYDSSGALSTEDLNKGISNNEFRLEYQPQVDLKSGDVVGFEALARWDHPRMGAVSPARFIPVLETSDAIDEFTLHVIEKAVTDMRAWNGTIKARVAINLSAANFKNLDIHDIVRSKCNRRGVDINRITIEITESAAMAVSGTITKRLESLSALGAHVSIDDFGTGYSSIGSLHALPFSELKIDRSFVYDCVSDSDRGIVVQSMINLGHNLRKSVVAEGVETIDTMDRLRSWTCDIAQGFFISKPMPPESVEGWVESYSKNAAA